MGMAQECGGEKKKRAMRSKAILSLELGGGLGVDADQQRN